MIIPACEFALIGGSSTLNVDEPEGLALDFVEVKETGLIFDTPFGVSPEFAVNCKTEDEWPRCFTCGYCCSTRRFNNTDKSVFA